MPSYRTRRRVPYTPEEMYAVVADVARYPEFLPLCESLAIMSRAPHEERIVLVATMTVGYKAIRESFTSRVTLEPQAPAVRVEFLDGPFLHLTNTWQFSTVPGGSEIEFFIDYEFRSTVYRLLMGAVFDSAVRHYTEAFEARAQALYGSRPPAAARSVVTR